MGHSAERSGSRTRPRPDGAASRGAVPTPPGLARRLAEALRELTPAPAAVLDPACGEGALLLAAREVFRGSSPPRLEGLELDARRLATARERLGADGPAALAVADALAPETRWPPGSAVLANPPWVSFSGRHAGRGSGAGAPAAGRGWPSLASTFLLRIAEHVAREGTAAAAIVPASLLELPGYAALRVRIDGLVRRPAPAERLPAAAFPGVSVPAALVRFAARVPGAGAPDAPWAPTSAADRSLLAALAPRPRPPAGTFADPGVHTGNCSEELVHAEPGAGRVPLRRGADLRAFALGPPGRFLRTDLPRRGGRRFRVGVLESFRSFPLLLRQTADRPLAALHRPAAPFRNSLLACRGVDGLAPAFLAAVLNGRVAAAWHRAAHADARQRRFPQVKVGQLTGLPLPLRAREEDRELHDRIAALVLALDPRRPDPEERRRIDRLVLAAYRLPDALGAAIAAWDPDSDPAPYARLRI